LPHRYLVSYVRREGEENACPGFDVSIE
jgi:hypothetical protein